MKVERIISRFDKTTEELLEERNIDDLSLEVLKKIFKPNTDDPLMYEPYTIYETEASELQSLIDIQFDLNKFFYQVDCFQI